MGYLFPKNPPSFLQIGLLISIILSLLPQAAQNGLTQLIKILFINNPSPFVWLVLPVVYLIAVGKFVGDSNEI